MTLREYLERQRRPEYCGINARRHMKRIVGIKGDAIDRKIALREIDVAVRNLVDALKAARKGPGLPE